MTKRKLPMTATEAQNYIEEIRHATKPSVQRFILKTALGPLGNLTNEAREVYRARLDNLNGETK